MITDEQREYGIPRGVGYDKASVLKLAKSLRAERPDLKKFLKAQGRHLRPFLLACEKYDPVLLGELRPLLPVKPCAYCGQEFAYLTKAQDFCMSSCSGRKRTDDSYFGGNRRATVGLEDKICQCCLRKVEKGISSHHVFGKSVDTDNKHLVALCRGCHDVVSRLALKTWCTDAAALARLIRLAVMQRSGKDFLSRDLDLGVEISLYPTGASGNG